MSIETRANLEKVREEMDRVGVDAVIIPGTDPHHSEYISGHWKVRDWVSGFTGSNGTAVVLQHDAGLWTDSRYFLQAGIQLAESGFSLHKERIPGEATITEWIAQELPDGGVIGIDGRLFSVMEVNAIENFCAQNGMQLVTDFDIADRVWDERPERPQAPIKIMAEEFAGESAESKLQRTMERVEAAGADALFVPSLDDIAWVLNLRGNDVLRTPVFISFLYLSEKENVLFVDSAKVSGEVADYLKKIGVKVKEYDDVREYLTDLKPHTSVMVDANTMSDTLAYAIPGEKIYQASPIAALKGCKNEVELNGFRACHVRDGVALVRTFKWIEETLGKQEISECDVADHAIEERGKMERYADESFDMIAGYKSNGAIVHYTPQRGEDATLAADGLLLVDTGGQYLDGTTDITRTVSLGNPTPAEIHDYTLVLKGTLALSRAIFPAGTRGTQLDVLARQFMWKEGVNYLHGTGHGVGHFLSVHEGPHSIRMNENPVTLKLGMVTSDEPGIYRAGEYGIRVENLLATVPAMESEEYGEFMKFETLTMFPYDLKLIDRTMLQAEEVAQINEYHALVRSKLNPYLSADEQAWLAEKTKEL